MFSFLHVVALLLHHLPFSCCCLLEALAVCGEAVVRVDGDDGGIVWLFPWSGLLVARAALFNVQRFWIWDTASSASMLSRGVTRSVACTLKSCVSSEYKSDTRHSYTPSSSFPTWDRLSLWEMAFPCTRTVWDQNERNNTRTHSWPGKLQKGTVCVVYTVFTLHYDCHRK